MDHFKTLLLAAVSSGHPTWEQAIEVLAKADDLVPTLFMFQSSDTMIQMAKEFYEWGVLGEWREYHDRLTIKKPEWVEWKVKGSAK